MAASENAYREILAQLPGVLSQQWGPPEARFRERGFDARLKLRTVAGSHQILVQQQKTHLSRVTVEHVLAEHHDSGEPQLLLAPHIGSGLGPQLAAAGLNYLDLRGNCHIGLPPFFVHIEGRPAPKASHREKGLRSAGYQVLFVYLAQPSLLTASFREVGAWAGVSRQAVSDMRSWLLDNEYILESKAGVTWSKRRLQDAIGLWLYGYETTVRPALLLGTYRTRDAEPLALETSIRRAFASGPRYRWGGGAAAFRLTEYYRGERTVVHFEQPPSDLRQSLGALVDPRGPLVTMLAPGRIHWSADSDSVHPLLVYSELLNDGNERSRESARVLYEKQIPVFAP